MKVDITAPDLCYRYIARVVKDVKIGESPKWMKKRLNACGVRSINNIVDITNYVMLELGQPMHAFDINSIEGKHITVRRANENEKITTLDGQVRNLDNEMLVIADEKKAVAIAGVMGGLNSEIEKDTETVVFESAVFYGGSVRKTAKKVGLRTEASSRYEKGLSPENAERAINRAIELVELIGAGKSVEGKVDVYPTKQKLNEVELDVERINRLLGTEISKEDMIKTLEKLEMKFENDVVTAPYFRADIEQEINEVLNESGYRISITPNNCPIRNGKDAVQKNLTANYEYCIYEYSNFKGVYYGVTAYIYYQIPLIGTELKFPVYGETKINGILG